MANRSYEGEGRTFNRGARDVEEPGRRAFKQVKPENMVIVHAPGGSVEVPESIYNARVNSDDERITGGYR